MAELSGRAVAAVVARPVLWPTALRLLPPGWWRHLPPRLEPPPEYLEFRVQTMYGDGRSTFDAADLLAYLKWCRKMHHRSR